MKQSNEWVRTLMDLRRSNAASPHVSKKKYKRKTRTQKLDRQD